MRAFPGFLFTFNAMLVPTFAPEVIVRAAPDRLALPFAKLLRSASAAIGVRKGWLVIG